MYEIAILGQKMKQLDTQQDKLNKICEVLRKDTLEPAEKEAEMLLNEAKAEAERIILQAEKEGQEILRQAKAEMEQERRVFHSSLQQAAKQGVELLRQEVENKLLSPELAKHIQTCASDPKVVASIIEALISGLQEKGPAQDLLAYIPKSISPQAVNALLLDSTLKKLKEGSVEVGSFKGGAKVKLQDKMMTVVLTDEALLELLLQFIRKDLRKFFFGH